MHSDVGLKFDKIGDPSELTFIAYCDAAFASRHDLSSQGGYLVMLVHNDVTTGSEGKYHLVDWRSWKLPRVARSSLAAESQAASEAADALLYVSTFWKLIWSPYLALDDAETPKLRHSPRLVTDAKALYDLLIKTDLQTGSQADKRTTIEVLVTQDKLACVDAKTLWVSSELQYADGMTKQAASLLLAERLRTHTTCLKPDGTFTASKKKTPEERRQNQQRYAAKRPSRAVQAAVLWSVATAAQATTEDDAEEHTFSNLVTLAAFTMLVVLFTNLLWTMSSRLRSSMASVTMGMVRAVREEICPDPACEKRDQDVQTVRTGAADETLVHLRAVNRTLQKELDEARRQIDRLRDAHNFHEERVRRQLVTQPVFVTNHGECWHAGELCCSQRSLNPVRRLRPCKACGHTLGNP